MRYISRIDYQHFLKICVQIHDLQNQYHSRIALTLALLAGVQASNSLKRLLIKKINGVVQKIVEMNQWAKARFEALYQDSLKDSFDAMERWFCDLALEDARNIHAFLEQHLKALEKLMAQLCLHYPHEQVPGFYFVLHFKKIKRNLLHAVEQQGRAIRYFEGALERCADLRIGSGSEQFSAVIAYCQWDSDSQKFQTVFNARSVYRKRGPQ